MAQTILGKIELASVGFDENGRFGFRVFLGCVYWEMGYWPDKNNPPHEDCSKLRDRRIKIMVKMEETLKSAKKQSIADLVGTPIEMKFDDTEQLTSWRVLEEVL